MTSPGHWCPNGTGHGCASSCWTRCSPDGRARYQRWEWNRDQPAEWLDVPTGRLVVIEGVSATRCELAAPWALQIWVEAPHSVRVRRAVARDGAAMLSHWLDVWMPSEEAYIDRERPQERVDLIVSGTE